MKKPFDVKIGCIADDYTGASDAASFLKKGGLSTVLCDGTPFRLDALGNCQAVVIALKTRSVAKEDAVNVSLKALKFLKKARVKTFYFKYCSTFDSTPRGNIGPVADAIMEDLKEKFTLLCPSLPVNKRTVKDGCLYVDGIPLKDSYMKDHPLNPMWASYISALMEPQSKYPCITLSAKCIRKGHDAIFKELSGLKGGEHFYIVPDYVTDEDGKNIAATFKDSVFLTGGAGLLEHLARALNEDSAQITDFPSATAGRGIALCGSCSNASKCQIEEFKASGGLSFAVDADKLLSGKTTVKEIWDFVESTPTSEVLVYSRGALEPRTETSCCKATEKKAKAIESAMAALGKLAYENNFTRIIVAGGETSGAVTKSLGFNSFYIGESVAPGVPIMTPTGATGMRIVLKSGNFGQDDFFKRALSMTKK